VSADIVSVKIGAPKIDDLDLAFVAHYVLEFDVAVDYVVAVQF
jgi:hypothetical protein